MDERITDPLHLVDDPTFRHYVRRTDPLAEQRWAAWLARHPEQAAVFREATRLVHQLDALPRHKLSDSEIAAELIQVQARLASNEPSTEIMEKPLHSHLLLGRFPSWLAAASVALLSLLGLWLYNGMPKPDSAIASVAQETSSPIDKVDDHSTPFGQRKRLVLPDGSVVMLNANSALQVVHWTATRREVSLRGEAFFQVSKKRLAGQPVKFVVRANNVAVEVLGTQFDVSTRNKRVKVVLNEGHIRLKVLDLKHPDAQPIRTLDMLPGDLAEIADEQNLTFSSQTETDKHLAWVSDELVFDETPLSEVARLIEENYGYSVQFADADLPKRRLTARLPDANMDILLKALSKAFSLSITQSDKTIRIAAGH
ncbi:FecR family protein [Persicitalea sp.]|uniref:FecR family protein n=1 Tax=Persicitalea sp. TaxID=3100273 RepID=UPI0035943892